MKTGFAGQSLSEPYPYYEHEEKQVDRAVLKENKFDVNGFPTIYFVKEDSAGNLVKEIHNGDRTKTAIDEGYETFLNTQ